MKFNYLFTLLILLTSPFFLLSSQKPLSKKQQKKQSESTFQEQLKSIEAVWENFDPNSRVKLTERQYSRIKNQFAPSVLINQFPKIEMTSTEKTMLANLGTNIQAGEKEKKELLEQIIKIEEERNKALELNQELKNKVEQETKKINALKKAIEHNKKRNKITQPKKNSSTTKQTPQQISNQKRFKTIQVLCRLFKVRSLQAVINAMDNLCSDIENDRLVFIPQGIQYDTEEQILSGIINNCEIEYSYTNRELEIFTDSF